MMQAALTSMRSASLDVEGGPTQASEAIAPSADVGPHLKLEALQFEQIYRESFGHVCRWVRALGGPPAERDDLVQDVFLIVHRRLPDFDGRNLHGWLYRITRHRVRDFRRLRWFRLLLHAGQVDDSLAGSFAGSRNPEGALEDKERAAILARLLSKLPEAQRAAFVLFEIDGYSGEEIASLQGVPLNTVWARIHKARAKLTAGIARLQRQSTAERCGP
jgi:RNA polymerase sigma-70 factor (ECF subfamily)